MESSQHNIQSTRIDIRSREHIVSSALRQDGLDILKATSRTFYIPISRLPGGLLEAVSAAYLCMRAIDEIEDHPEMPSEGKAWLLRNISQCLQSADGDSGWTDLQKALISYHDTIPEVTLRLSEWVQLAPGTIAPRIWDSTASMADRMANWVATNWEIHTKTDLDRYTFSVASAVGLMLSDLWAWYDGTQSDRIKAISFGRGLQSVNILRNRDDDLARGVDFFPDGWQQAEMQAYARRNLDSADAYTDDLPSGPAKEFCLIPLILAHATVDALAEGRSKLTRSEVITLVGL